MTDSQNHPHQYLQTAVTKVLKPLVRLLLRHGVSHAEFSNWAKQAYVNEASQNFGLDSKSPTISRISIVTGINRKEVKRISALDNAVDTGLSQHNRAIRVLTGWLQDEKFLDSQGQPKTLVYGAAGDSFNQLVKCHGGDVPAKAVLDELVRTGTATLENGKVAIQRRGYVPHRSEQAMLDVFSISASDLLTTLDHNLAHTENRRFQMSVAYDRVGREGAAVFKRQASQQAMKLLKELDQLLSQYDCDIHPGIENDGEHRIGLGIYLIDDDIEEHTNED